MQRPRYRKISAGNDAACHHALHRGKGSIDVAPFAFFGETRTPYFVTFDMPPGSSEGVHVHGAEDPAEGWLDEYYYVISGSGVMQLDDDILAIDEGDFVYAPAGVAHGIENTAETGNLKVMLTVIRVPEN